MIKPTTLIPKRVPEKPGTQTLAQSGKASSMATMRTAEQSKKIKRKSPKYRSEARKKQQPRTAMSRKRSYFNPAFGQNPTRSDSLTATHYAYDGYQTSYNNIYSNHREFYDKISKKV